MAGESWPRVRLETIAANDRKGFAMGPFGSNIKSENYQPTGVPVLRGVNLGDGGFSGGDLVFLSEEKAEELKNSQAFPDDLVFVAQGTVGRVALVPNTPRFQKTVLSQNLMKFSCDTAKADSRFLYYFFISADGQQTIRSRVNPTGVPCISRPLSSLKEFEVTLPPLAEQKAIAAVLGALDDKIELNRRMNATLEAMARALFQSWFVDFDPVRAKLDGRPPAALDPATAALFPDSFQDSQIGHIPKGWEVRPLAEAFDIKDGATFRKEDRVESGSIIAFGANGPVGFSTRANVSEPCIALGKIGSCGSLHRNWNPCWVTNNAFIVKPYRGGSLEFVWRTLCTIDFNQFIGGSANPYMPLKNFGHTPVVMPPPLLLNAYQERAGSLAAKIVANDEQSRTLATLRDTLLPKLLSGELSVN